ncbi:MAG: transposase [Phycisphaerales bacterium]
MPHDTAVRQKARDALQHPVVVFDGMQARAIARGFARAVSASGHVIRACAIMPDHVHVVVMRHPQPVEQIVTHLKTRATQQLRAESLHPFEREVHTSCWARSFWSRYLSDAEDVARSADYVNANPRRAGLKVQRWNFVKPA